MFSIHEFSFTITFALKRCFKRYVVLLDAHDIPRKDDQKFTFCTSETCMNKYVHENWQQIKVSPHDEL